MPLVDALEVLTEEGRFMVRETRRGVANDTLIRRCPNPVTDLDAKSRKPRHERIFDLSKIY